LAKGAAVTVAVAKEVRVVAAKEAWVAVAKEARVVAPKEAWVAAKTVAESSAVEGGASGDPRECAEGEWAAVGKVGERAAEVSAGAPVA